VQSITRFKRGLSHRRSGATEYSTA